MNTKIKLVGLSIMIISFLSANAQSQEKGLVYGNSFSVSIPAENMETYQHGFGVIANFDYNFNKNIAARFDLGWSDFSGDERTYVDSYGMVHVDHPNMSVWEFTGGLRAKVSVLYIEARGGYFTGVNSWGYTPAVGLRIGKFDLQANYTVAGDNQWGGVRVAYYYGLGVN